MRSLTIVLTCLTLFPLQSGCALMFNGRHQNVTITTYPAHADLTVDSLPGNTYKAPTSVRLRRSRQHIITAREDGFEDASAVVTRHVDGVAVALDCAVWLCIPLLFEWPLGAIYELDPTAVTIVLERPNE